MDWVFLQTVKCFVNEIFRAQDREVLEEYEGGLKISDLTKIQDIFSEMFKLFFNIVSYALLPAMLPSL